jgi:hypothetical protein
MLVSPLTCGNKAQPETCPVFVQILTILDFDQLPPAIAPVNKEVGRIPSGPGAIAVLEGHRLARDPGSGVLKAAEGDKIPLQRTLVPHLTGRQRLKPSDMRASTERNASD